jgi:hypothetical protein
MKTLMIACTTVFSLGAGVAMAQGEMPSSAEGAYFSQQHQAAPQTSESDRLQSGSSDVAPTHSGATRTPNWQTLPNFTDPG